MANPNVEKDLVADVQSRYRQPVENQVGKSQLAVSRTFVAFVVCEFGSCCFANLI